STRKRTCSPNCWHDPSDGHSRRVGAIATSYEPREANASAPSPPQFLVRLRIDLNCVRHRISLAVSRVGSGTAAQRHPRETASEAPDRAAVFLLRQMQEFQFTGVPVHARDGTFQDAAERVRAVGRSAGGQQLAVIAKRQATSPADVGAKSLVVLVQCLGTKRSL